MYVIENHYLSSLWNCKVARNSSKVFNQLLFVSPNSRNNGTTSINLFTPREMLDCLKLLWYLKGWFDLHRMIHNIFIYITTINSVSFFQKFPTFSKNQKCCLNECHFKHIIIEVSPRLIIHVILKLSSLVLIKVWPHYARIVSEEFPLSKL